MPGSGLARQPHRGVNGRAKRDHRGGAIILVLALLNARKKLSMIPLGTAVLWLQIHVFVGLASVVVFLGHLRWSLPSGPLECALAIVFVLVAVTGCVGLMLSRVLAPRLRRSGDEVIFERIPGFVRGLRRRAEEPRSTVVDSAPPRIPIMATANVTRAEA